jgi:hypothetical protein
MIIGASIQMGDEIMHRSKIVAISTYLAYLFLLEALDLYVESAEILGDPYSKKSQLPSIGNSPRLAISPKVGAALENFETIFFFVKIIFL